MKTEESRQINWLDLSFLFIFLFFCCYLFFFYLRLFRFGATAFLKFVGNCGNDRKWPPLWTSRADLRDAQRRVQSTFRIYYPSFFFSFSCFNLLICVCVCVSYFIFISSSFFVCLKYQWTKYWRRGIDFKRNKRLSLIGLVWLWLFLESVAATQSDPFCYDPRPPAFGDWNKKAE